MRTFFFFVFLVVSSLFLCACVQPKIYNQTTIKNQPNTCAQGDASNLAKIYMSSRSTRGRKANRRSRSNTYMFTTLLCPCCWLTDWCIPANYISRSYRRRRHIALYCHLFFIFLLLDASPLKSPFDGFLLLYFPYWGLSFQKYCIQ